MILSKTLDPSDYQELEYYIQYIHNLWGLPSRVEHEHRKWEYSITCKALQENNVKTVLDVGGGGSMLAPMLTFAGMDVLQVDPGNNDELLLEQSRVLGKELAYDRIHFELWEKDDIYDAVVCISVLEHVLDDLAMFRKLLIHARKIVVITVDFSKDGKSKSQGHLRTYNKESMQNFIKVGKAADFTPLGGQVDYSERGNHVYDYNFASLVLEKTDG